MSLSIIYIYFSFTIPYLMISFIFCLIDLGTRLIKYRYQKPGVNLLREIYNNTYSLVFSNLFFIYPSLICILSNFVDIRFTGFNHGECIWSLLIFSFFFEITFYITHRILHMDFFFNLIHYKHHELNISIAFGGIYCHPLEFIFGNFLSAFIGIYLLQTCYIHSINNYLCSILNIHSEQNHHINTLCIWSFLAGCSISTTHSGYFGTHVIHHWYKRCYYGTFGFMDLMFQTQLENTVIRRGNQIMKIKD
jgi:sterol desaturase/sphingolipid hydroxylase (fatty acid hydroxylase superfamily)